jgi:hypothetical protein
MATRVMVDDAQRASGKSRLIEAVAWFLALGGGLAILYAGFLPIPPFSETPVPPVMEVYGVAGLAAAAGVGLRRTWGRALGVFVQVIGLLFYALRLANTGPGLGTADLPAAAITTALNVAALWVLIRRWPVGAQG